MITRRIVANLIAFALVSAALIAYGFLDLLGNPLRSTTTVSAVLPSASGLAPNFLVTLNGVDVGSVKSVSLTPGGARVAMTLNSGTRVPSDVKARVVVANALGEEEVQLVPTQNDAAPVIRAGAVVPASPDSTPADVGTVVAEATRFLQAIPPDALNTVLHELAVALNGNAGNLRAIASSSALFSQEFVSYQQQFEALLANSPPVLDTITQNAVPLRQGLADTVVLAQVLASHSSDLTRLFDQGANASQALDSLVTQNRPNLACLLHDSADLNANLAAAPNLSNLATTLATNQEFFGAVAAISPTGPAKALTSSDHASNNQEWLRTRLLLPPGQPAASTYTQPTSLPAVLPGAACNTEFGAGAPAATQAGFHPAGPDARVQGPTAAESRVRGGGPTAVGAAPADARVARSDSAGTPLVALAGLVVVAWIVTLGSRRRSARSARPVRLSSASGRAGVVLTRRAGGASERRAGGGGAP